MSSTILVVMGVSGCGKSTIAGLLSGDLGWPLLEGDDVHPQANVDKMAAGIPLTDDDRWPWLREIAAWIDERLAAGESGVITCSALRQVYRDILRRNEVRFVHLAGGQDEVSGRLTARTGHFMPATLLTSQLGALEPLAESEKGVTVSIGAGPREIADEVLRGLDVRGGQVLHVVAPDADVAAEG